MEEKIGTKRKRSENWTEDDKELLKELIRPYVKTIENKNTDSNTNQSKKKAWQEVTESFNNFCTGDQRTVTQLKNQWVATKIAAKKHRKQLQKIGVGLGSSEIAARSSDITDWMPNEFTIDPNEFDSDMVVNETVISNNFENEAAVIDIDKTNTEEKIIPIADEKLNCSSAQWKQYEKKKLSLKHGMSELHFQKRTEFDIQCRAELHQLQLKVEKKKLEAEEKKIRNLDRELQMIEEKIKFHRNRALEPCIKFLIKQAESLELLYKIHYVAENGKKPVFIASWIGTNPKEPSILVNSHMDVVPVFEDKWSHPPFAAEIDDEGRIYARGSQDCKCVGMQYFAAIRMLKSSKTQIKRTLHVMFVPDEEIGGDFGMQKFIKSNEFRDLNVGFALDEGAATDDDKFVAYYAERSIWQINFKFNGPAGHGSFMLENTVGERLSLFLNKIMAYRTSEAERLKKDSNLHMGDVTTINLTMIKGGVQPNVVPSELVACFDMRIAVDVDLKKFEKLLQEWCTEVGGNIEWEWIFRCDTAPPTKVDKTNPYWCAFKEAFEQMNLRLEAHVYMGGSDVQFLRELGIPSIGFSPMNNTPKLMHDHDEYLKADIYLRGIEIYKNIFRTLLNF